MSARPLARSPSAPARVSKDISTRFADIAWVTVAALGIAAGPIARDSIVLAHGPKPPGESYWIAPSIEHRSELPKALDPLSATKQFLAQRYERDISDHEALSVIENIRLIFSLLEEEARRVDRA